jgi:hypothetical protein
MYLLHDIQLHVGCPFNDPVTGIQYPLNWLELSTKADRDAIGIIEQPDPPPVDPDPIPLDQQKRMKIMAIDDKTRSLILEGFSFDSHMFSMSDAAQKNWILLGVGRSLGMFTESNLPILSTSTEEPYILDSLARLDQFIATFAQYQIDPNKPLNRGRTLKALVTSATSQEELDAIIDDR